MKAVNLCPVLWLGLLLYWVEHTHGQNSKSIECASICPLSERTQCHDAKLVGRSEKAKALKLPGKILFRGGSAPREVTTEQTSGLEFDVVALGANFARFCGEFVLLTSLLAFLQLGSQYIEGLWQQFASVVVWLTIVFGSSFIVNLPGQWAEKVQLLKPTTPGASQTDWYSSLSKPWWNPPGWLFPLMWIPLKTLQLIAGVIIWNKVEMDFTHPAIVCFIAYTTLGDLWNKIFFDQRRIGFGLVAIYTFYGYLIASTSQYWSISKLAGGLIFPTNLWVFVASSLNLSIWLRNGKEPLYPVKAVQSKV